MKFLSVGGEKEPGRFARRITDGEASKIGEAPHNGEASKTAGQSLWIRLA
ncbi:MAG: hypothetical protein PUD02_00065 [Eggerthellales bacterium]|nr:hypothetical protein [Eggerthellales bacterium]